MSHMRQITVRYHKEAGTWWAESPNLPGFSAAADSREELRALVAEGVAFAIDDEPHMILEAAWDTYTSANVSTLAGTSPAELTPQFGYKTRRTPSYLSTNPRLVLQ